MVINDFSLEQGWSGDFTVLPFSYVCQIDSVNPTNSPYWFGRRSTDPVNQFNWYTLCRRAYNLSAL